MEPDIQHLSLDRRRFPSSFVVRPRDLTRLLSNFQSSLQEITIIATEPSALPSDAAGEIGGKAVELRSYIDPTKGLFLGTLLHVFLGYYLGGEHFVLSRLVKLLWFFHLQIIVIWHCTHNSGSIQLKSSYSIHILGIPWILLLV